MPCSRWSSPSSSTRGERGPHPRFALAARRAVAVTPDDLVEPRRQAAGDAHPRAGDRPAGLAKLSFISSSDDYARPSRKRAARRPQRRVGAPTCRSCWTHRRRTELAEIWLFEAWAARERAAFALPPSLLALEPGRYVSLIGGRRALFRITEIGEHGARDIEARGVRSRRLSSASPAGRRPGARRPMLSGQPLVFLDLPLLRGDEPPTAGYVAARQNPWPGGVAFYRSPETAGFALRAVAAAPATTGVTLDALPAARGASITPAVAVRLEAGELVPATCCSSLPGATWRGENADGEWEVAAVPDGALVAPGTYVLHFLRGQGGTESPCGAVAPAPASFCSTRVARVDWRPGDRPRLYWRFGRRRATSAMPPTPPTTHTFQGLGPSRCAPCTCAAARGGGDLAIAGCAARASAATAGTVRRAARRGYESATRSTSSTAPPSSARSQALCLRRLTHQHSRRWILVRRRRRSVCACGRSVATAAPGRRDQRSCEGTR